VLGRIVTPRQLGKGGVILLRNLRQHLGHARDSHAVHDGKGGQVGKGCGARIAHRTIGGGPDLYLVGAPAGADGGVPYGSDLLIERVEVVVGEQDDAVRLFAGQSQRLRAESGVEDWNSPGMAQRRDRSAGILPRFTGEQTLQSLEVVANLSLIGRRMTDRHHIAAAGR
jgi:hypothetical protein